MRAKSPLVSRLLTLTGLLTLSATLATAQPYTYQTIDVPFPGATDTYVRGLAQGGTLSGVYRDATGLLKGFVGKPGAFQKVFTRTRPVLEVDDVNSSLRLVGGLGLRGFTLQGGTLRTFGFAVYAIQACSVNDANLIACSMYDPFSTPIDIVVLFSAGGTVLETFVGTSVGEESVGTNTWAFGINNLNDLVGAISNDALDEDFRYIGWAREGSASPNPGQEHRFEAPCGGHTLIRDLNDTRLMVVTCGEDPWSPSSQVVSYVFDPVREVWTELEVPGALATHVTRINNLGQIVGWYEGADGRDHGFIA